MAGYITEQREERATVRSTRRKSASAPGSEGGGSGSASGTDDTPPKKRSAKPSSKSAPAEEAVTGTGSGNRVPKQRGEAAAGGSSSTAKPAKSAKSTKATKTTKTTKTARSAKTAESGKSAKSAGSAVAKTDKTTKTEKGSKDSTEQRARKISGDERRRRLEDTASTLLVRPDEAAWSPEELEAIAAELHAEADRLRAEISMADSEFSDLLWSPGDGAGDDQADAGSRTFEREHEMSLNANARELLAQAERAFDRIADGTYGNCERCGNPIGKARLQAFPRATLCVSCKQREERR